MKSLLGMVFMDKNGLFQTNFEYMVFTSVYLIHSFYYSANGLINDYIKKVILNLFLNNIDHRYASVIFINNPTEEKCNIPTENKVTEAIFRSPDLLKFTI
jgi:hypothetical protein